MAESVQELPLTPIHPAIVPLAGLESTLFQGDFSPIPAADDAAPPLPVVVPPRAPAAQSRVDQTRPEPRISAPTAAETEDFAQWVRQALRAAGVDVATPIELCLRAAEVITAAHPDAAVIEATLNGNPDLAAAYRTLAARCDLHAQAHFAASSFLAWHAAKTEDDRDAARRRYAVLADQFAREASGRLRIGPDDAMSLALQFALERGVG